MCLLNGHAFGEALLFGSWPNLFSFPSLLFSVIQLSRMQQAHTHSSVHRNSKRNNRKEKQTDFTTHNDCGCCCCRHVAAKKRKKKNARTSIKCRRYLVQRCAEYNGTNAEKRTMRRHALMGSWLKRGQRKKRKGKLRASAYRAPPKCDFRREKRN